MEIAADLADFVEEDCKRLYPKLHDEAPGAFPPKKPAQGPEGLQVRIPIGGAVVASFKQIL